MKRLVGVWILLLFSNWILAQNTITRLEYFLGNDPGYGNGIAVVIPTSTDIPDIDIPLNVSALPSGIYLFGVRAQDNNGAWSLNQRWLFNKPFSHSTDNSIPNLVALEWFIGADPGFGNGTQVPVSNSQQLADLLINLDLTAFNEGIHQFTLRAKDALGNWSLNQRWLFNKPFSHSTDNSIPNLVALEWFIGADPGFGNGTQVPISNSQQLADLLINLDLTAFNEGIHQFTLRAKDALGNWSLNQRWLFAKPYAQSIDPAERPQLQLLEYFIDTDPGIGLGIPVQTSPSLEWADLNVPVDISSLSMGEHKIYFRSRDANGNWSLVNQYVFIVGELVSITYYRDNDHDGYGDPEISVSATSQPEGYVTDNTDCDDAIATVYPSAPESCDGLDNDCDGQTDEDVTSTFYADADEDGYGNAEVSIRACIAPAGYVADNSDCDDGNATIYPSAPEICDGLDNDCNGQTDEIGSNTFYADVDEDGFGDPNTSTSGCDAPAGYVTDNSDCDDVNASVYPNAPELCDGLDNDCNGQTDENGTATFYADADEDGFGDAEVSILACSAPAGYVDDNSDCDDGNAAIYPSAPEICDGLDNDCNGQTDENGTTTFYADADEDGFGDPNTSTLGCDAPAGYVTDNSDCDDGNAAIYPSAPEICDGLDNDCNGQIDENGSTTFYADADEDGFGDSNSSITTCNAPTGYVTNNSDCDDTKAEVNPDATEICDGLDNDCDGETDEEGSTTFYLDADEDGFGDPNTSITTCNAPTGYVTNNSDCDDTKAEVNPDATETCDGLDNDCDGQTDEDGSTTFYLDADEDGFGDPNSSISGCNAPAGYVTDNSDCDDGNASVYPSAPEICDGLDNDCNGQTDENGATTFYADADEDGFGDPNSSISGCNAPAGYVTDNSDCDDGNASVYPSAPELCDGLDNDCNGQTDENGSTIFYADADEDGYGDAGVSIQACSAPAGYVADNSDCDDGNASIYPSAPELCDGLDNDCNGQTDENGATTFYVDADEDGFGDPNSSISGCNAPAGYVTDNSDCDDGNASVYPSAPELCDGLDNDCNGQTDENGSTTFYADADEDGYGDAEVSVQACIAPAGYVADNSDCDDGNASIYPSAPEICDGLDNDCNGQIDENGSTTFYTDADEDGFGDPNSSIITCNAPTGYVTNNSDCDDGNASVYPSAPELCDGLDNDCNGQTDENGSTTFYADADEDGFGDPNTSTSGCNAPTGYVTNNSDCNDGNASIYPGAPEICDGLDNNCDGQIDPQCNSNPVIYIDDANVYEDAGYVLVRVYLSSIASSTVMVHYITIDGTAKSMSSQGAEADYKFSIGLVKIPAGQLSTTIRIPIIMNRSIEPTEYFNVVLSKPKNALIGDASATVNINDASSLITSSGKQLPSSIDRKWEIKVYPNPSSSYFQFMSYGKIGQTMNLRVVDQLGRIIESRAALPARGSFSFGSNYAPGIYFVQIIMDKEINSIKLIKQPSR